MPDRLSIHAPVLVNTIGHCAGVIVFGILLYLLLLDWRRATGERSVLPGFAAGLALLWNLGSLIGMATSPQGDPDCGCNRRCKFFGAQPASRRTPAYFSAIEASRALDDRLRRQLRRHRVAHRRPCDQRAAVSLRGPSSRHDRFRRTHHGLRCAGGIQRTERRQRATPAWRDGAVPVCDLVRSLRIRARH